MPYCILIVLLELKIRDTQRFKVVVEVEARKHFTYLEPRRFLLDGRLLNLFLHFQLCVSYLLLKLADLQILLTLSIL